MVIKDYSVNNKTIVTKLSNYVEAHIGTSYCVLLCSKHNLSELVSVVDDLCSKGWATMSGITSEDGKIIQSMSKLPLNSEQLNQGKGV